MPQDGEYVLAIYDAIYRGREDFVYRITIGEMPFVTSIFPLGGRVGAPPVGVKFKGWNLSGAELKLPSADAGPGIHRLAAVQDGMHFQRRALRPGHAAGMLRAGAQQRPGPGPDGHAAGHHQRAHRSARRLGRVQIHGPCRRDDRRRGSARRLDSPLDSVLKITDAAGKLLAFNDDHEDLEAGINTHDADSYLMVKLPADGTYYVHLGDTAAPGGEEYAYRLRISAPRPDFALRVVPSSVGFRSKGSAALTVYAIRKDGFKGPIKWG